MKNERSIIWSTAEDILFTCHWSVTLDVAYRDGRRLRLKKHLSEHDAARLSNNLREIRRLKYDMLRDMATTLRKKRGESE